MNESTLPESCTFRTKDLNQAAFVWCQPTAEIVRLEGATDKGTSVFFVFNLQIDERDLAKLILEYANKKTVVEPQEFCNKQNNLRDLLHGNLNRLKREKKPA